MRKKRLEPYHEFLARLFPEENKQSAQNITFQVTDACNLQCTYCYQKNKGHHIMPFEVAQKFIDLLIENNDNTKKYIDSYNSIGLIMEFIGGEPFLEVELMDKIITYFLEQLIIHNHPWQYNYRISICSNGVLYFTPKVQSFLKKWKDHLSFNISIDGNKKLHDACRIFPDGSGSYDIAIAGVHHYVEELDGVMGSKMTLAPENIQYTCEAVQSLIKQGYDDINLNCIFEKGWTNEHATILYYQLKELSDWLIEKDLFDKIYISMFEEDMFKPKDINDDANHCGGNGKMIAVDWKGDIYPCVRYMESSLGTDAPPIIVGNVYEGINTTKCQHDCIRCLKNINRINQSTEECINCSIAEGCAYCQAYNYQDSGGDLYHRATYICVMHQARALANSYYWNKYFNLNNENKRMKIWLEKEKALKIIPEEEWNMLKALEGLD